MRALVIISLLALAACGPGDAPQIVERLPVQIAKCPDPEARERLSEGSTFRDLAQSRVEALAGWEQCYSAAVENGKSAQ